MISNPKAFMQQYGEYIKIINRRLKMIEKRRAELRKRKGMTEAAGDVNPLTDITKMDFDAVDYCIRSIDECLNAPDSEIFVLTEAKTKEEDDDDQHPAHERVLRSHAQGRPERCRACQP